MPTRKPYQPVQSSLRERIFQATGMSPENLTLFLVLLVAVAAGIGFIVSQKRSNSAKMRRAATEGREQSPSDVSAKVSEEGMYIDICTVPDGFERKPPLERITVLEEKIVAAKQLIASGGEYSTKAKDRLVRLFSFKGSIEDRSGIDSRTSFEQLKLLRDEAAATGATELLNTANFLFAYTKIIRLENNVSAPAFEGAKKSIDAVDGQSVTEISQALRLYNASVDLFDDTTKRPQMAEVLTRLGKKFAESPVTEISDMGLNLVDYPFFGMYYGLIKNQSYTDREEKFALFRDLFTQIAKTPPQGPRTYETTISFFDELLNETDSKYAGVLLERLSIAASGLNEKVREYVSLAVSKIEKRVSRIGNVIDLSGTAQNGTKLELPNNKPTVIVFWNPLDQKSTQFIKLLAESERFDVWATNILIASISELTEEEFARFQRPLARFTVLDNPTAQRLVEDLGIDRVPYMVTLNSEGTVIRMTGRAL